MTRRPQCLPLLLLLLLGLVGPSTSLGNVSFVATYPDYRVDLEVVGTDGVKVFAPIMVGHMEDPRPKATRW